MATKMIKMVFLSVLLCPNAALCSSNWSTTLRSEVQAPISSSLARTVVRISSLAEIKDIRTELLFLSYHLLESLVRGEYLVEPQSLKAAVQKLHEASLAQGTSLHEFIVRSAHPNFLRYVQDYIAAKCTHQIVTNTEFKTEFWDQNFYYGDVGSAHRKNIQYYRNIEDQNICFCCTYDYQKFEIIIDPHPESSVELCNLYIQVFAEKISLYRDKNGDTFKLEA